MKLEIINCEGEWIQFEKYSWPLALQNSTFIQLMYWISLQSYVEQKSALLKILGLVCKFWKSLVQIQQQLQFLAYSYLSFLTLKTPFRLSHHSVDDLTRPSPQLISDLLWCPIQSRTSLSLYLSWHIFFQVFNQSLNFILGRDYE